jgi:hypothetical protein
MGVVNATGIVVVGLFITSVKLGDGIFVGLAYAHTSYLTVLIIGHSQIGRRTPIELPLTREQTSLWMAQKVYAKGIFENK